MEDTRIQIFKGQSSLPQKCALVTKTKDVFTRNVFVARKREPSQKTELEWICSLDRHCPN